MEGCHWNSAAGAWSCPMSAKDKILSLLKAKNLLADIQPFSDEYFEHIDNYISKIKKESPKNSKSMNSMAPVGAVRNSYTSSVNGKASSSTQMILTADEKRMCANSGISEKEWLKYKLEDLKKGK